MRKMVDMMRVSLQKQQQRSPGCLASGGGARELRSAVRTALLAGLMVGGSLHSGASAAHQLGTITVTATVGGGGGSGGGGGGGGAWSIEWNTDTQTWSDTSGWPAEVVAAMCGAIEQELESRSCAQVPPPVANGCGPVFGVSLPNGNFGFACDRHDNCYASPNVARALCDGWFVQDMGAVCQTQAADRISFAIETMTSPWREAEIAAAEIERFVCLHQAALYGSAVIAFGGSRYEAAQAAGACEALRRAARDLGCGASP